MNFGAPLTRRRRKPHFVICRFSLICDLSRIVRLPIANKRVRNHLPGTGPSGASHKMVPGTFLNNTRQTETNAMMEMEKLVSLCKRRGFLFQSSEIYGGLNGFWDYGPLGVELKRNVSEAWWRDMVTGHDDSAVPPGAPSLRNDRAGLHDHHAPAGLEMLGALRSVPRLHGRLPRIEEPIPPRPGPRPLGRMQGAKDLCRHDRAKWTTSRKTSKRGP